VIEFASIEQLEPFVATWEYCKRLYLSVKSINQSLGNWLVGCARGRRACSQQACQLVGGQTSGSTSILSWYKDPIKQTRSDAWSPLGLAFLCFQATMCCHLDGFHKLCHEWSRILRCRRWVACLTSHVSPCSRSDGFFGWLLSCRRYQSKWDHLKWGDWGNVQKAMEGTRDGIITQAAKEQEMSFE
jgi:hypothetical protein